ncbi:ankyrin repeat domain-containing protein [Candidatus Dependentiae bacterium]
MNKNIVLKTLLLSTLLAPCAYGMKKDAKKDLRKRKSFFIYPGSKDVFYLAANGNLKGVKFLIEEVNPANLEAKTPFKETLLHLAARHNQIEIVKYLLTKKVDINAKNKNNETPLFLAVKAGNKTITKLLIKAGANVILKNKKNKTPLHFATEKNNARLIRILLVSIKNKNLLKEYLEQTNSKGLNALHTAAYNGKEEALKLLIKYGADIEAKTVEKEKKIKKKKIKIEDSPSCENTCCDDLSCNCYEVESFLCEETPLILASIRGHVNIVKFLLSKGANVNAKDICGWTALHSTPYEYIAKILLDNKANIETKNKAGQTPIFTANNTNIVKLLLKNGAKINIKDNNNNHTPLLEAVAQGNLKITEILIKNGANIEVENSNSYNALLLACEGFPINPRIAKLLIQKGIGFTVLEKNYYDIISKSPAKTYSLDHCQLGDEQIINVLKKYTRYEKQFKLAMEKLISPSKIKSFLKHLTTERMLKVLLVFIKENFDFIQKEKPVIFTKISPFIQEYSKLGKDKLRNEAKEHIEMLLHSKKISLQNKEIILYALSPSTYLKCFDIVTKADKNTLSYIKKLMLSDNVPTHIKKLALPLLLKNSNEKELTKFFASVCFDSLFLTKAIYKKAVKYAIKHNLKDVNNRTVKKAAIILGKLKTITPIIQKVKQDTFGNNAKKTMCFSDSLVTIKFTPRDEKKKK